MLDKVSSCMALISMSAPAAAHNQAVTGAEHEAELFLQSMRGSTHASQGHQFTGDRHPGAAELASDRHADDAQAAAFMEALRQAKGL